MKILFTLQIREAKKYWKETTIVVISMLIVITTLTAIISTFSGFYEGFREATLLAEPKYNAIFSRVEDVDQLIQSGDDVELFEVISLVGSVDYAKDDIQAYPEDAFNISTIPQKETSLIEEETLSWGRLPRASDEIVISHLLAEAFQIEENTPSEISVKWNNGTGSHVKVVGIKAQSYPIYNQVKTDMDSKSNTVYVKFLDSTSTFSASIDNMKQSNRLSDQDIYLNANRNEYLGLTKHKNPLWIMVVGLAACIVIIFSISSILTLYHITNIIITRSAKNISILTSIGATKKQIKKSMYSWMFLNAIPCTLLGFVLGIKLSQLLIQIAMPVLSNERIFGYNLSTYIFPKLSVELIILLILIFIAIIAIPLTLALNRHHNHSSIALLNDNQRLKKENHDYPLSVISKNCSIPCIMAYKNITRDKQKYKYIIRALTIAMVSSVVMISFLVSTMDLASSKLDNAGYALEVDADEDGMQIMENSLARFIDPENTFKYKKDNGSIRLDLKTENDQFWIQQKTIILEDDLFNSLYPEVDLYQFVLNDSFTGTRLDYDSNSNVSMNGRLTETEVGELIKFQGGQKGGEFIKAYQIGKIVSDFDNPLKVLSNIDVKNSNPSVVVIVSTSLFSDLQKHDPEIEIPEIKNQKMLIQTTDADLIEDYIKSGEVGLQSVMVRNYDKEFKQDQEVYDMLIQVVFVVLGMFLMIILANILSTATSEHEHRKGEFAMLQSVGMPRKDIRKMLCFEALFTMLKVILWGTLLSFGLFYTMGLLLRRIIIIPNLEFKYNVLLTVIAVLIGIQCFMIIVSVRQFKRESILDQLKSHRF